MSDDVTGDRDRNSSEDASSAAGDRDEALRIAPFVRAEKAEGETTEPAALDAENVLAERVVEAPALVDPVSAWEPQEPVEIQADPEDATDDIGAPGPAEEGQPLAEISGAAEGGFNDDCIGGAMEISAPSEEAADAALTAEEARVAEEARLAAEAEERDRLERAERAREAAEAEERAAAAARAEAEAAAREKAERAAFIEENTLGSLLRGARATLGKHDMKIVEREIRIKAKYLHAIEALDIDNLPSEAYLPGYVRTYAAHLRAALPLKPEEALAKFRLELAAKRGVPLESAVSETEEEISRRAAQALSERIAPKISRTPIERAKSDARADEGGKDAPDQRAPGVARPVAARVSPADALRARAEEARSSTTAASATGRRIASLDPMAKVERLGAQARAEAPKISVKAAASSEVVAKRRQAAVEREAKRAAEVARASKKARAAVLRGGRDEQGVDPIGPGVALLTAALVIGGLSYGAWSLLTDVQKVTPDENGDRTLTVVETLDPAMEAKGVARPAAGAYEPGGALTVGGEKAALDGPIGGLTGGGEVRDAVDAALAAAALSAGGPEFAIHALDVSWLRVTNKKGEVVFAGRLDQGAIKALDLSKGPYKIRAGNAGGVAFIIDGAVRGPLGGDGRVTTVTVREKSDFAALAELPQATAALAERRRVDDGPIGAPAPR